MVAEQTPDLPIVLYGHSMRSLVVLDYLLQRPGGLAGAIISGVAIKPVGVASAATIALARGLTHVLPRFSVSLGIDESPLTRDPGTQETRAADPLVTNRATVRWGTESLDTVARVKDGMSSIDLPLLVIHGGADQLNWPRRRESAIRGDTQPRQRVTDLSRRVPRAAQRPWSRASRRRYQGVADARPGSGGLADSESIVVECGRD